jgi:hypothetical protein
MALFRYEGRQVITVNNDPVSHYYTGLAIKPERGTIIMSGSRINPSVVTAPIAPPSAAPAPVIPPEITTPAPDTMIDGKPIPQVVLMQIPKGILESSARSKRERIIEQLNPWFQISDKGPKKDGRIPVMVKDKKTDKWIPNPLLENNRVLVYKFIPKGQQTPVTFVVERLNAKVPKFLEEYLPYLGTLISGPLGKAAFAALLQGMQNAKNGEEVDKSLLNGNVPVPLTADQKEKQLAVEKAARAKARQDRLKELGAKLSVGHQQVLDELQNGKKEEIQASLPEAQKKEKQQSRTDFSEDVAERARQTRERLAQPSQMPANLTPAQRQTWLTQQALREMDINPIAAANGIRLSDIEKGAAPIGGDKQTPAKTVDEAIKRLLKADPQLDENSLKKMSLEELQKLLDSPRANLVNELNYNNPLLRMGVAAINQFIPLASIVGKRAEVGLAPRFSVDENGKLRFELKSFAALNGKSINLNAQTGDLLTFIKGKDFPILKAKNVPAVLEILAAQEAVHKADDASFKKVIDVLTTYQQSNGFLSPKGVKELLAIPGYIDPSIQPMKANLTYNPTEVLSLMLAEKQPDGTLSGTTLAKVIKMGVPSNPSMTEDDLKKGLNKELTTTLIEQVTSDLKSLEQETYDAEIAFGKVPVQNLWDATHKLMYQNAKSLERINYLTRSLKADKNKGKDIVSPSLTSLLVQLLGTNSELLNRKNYKQLDLQVGVGKQIQFSGGKKN